MTRNRMRLGVRAHDFGKLPVDELAARIAAKKIRGVQLALNKAIAGLDLKPGDLNPGLAFHVGQAFVRHGIQIAVVFDPVNLLTFENHREQQRVVVESLALFGDRVVAVHAKDFRRRGERLENRAGRPRAVCLGALVALPRGPQAAREHLAGGSGRGRRDRLCGAPRPRARGMGERFLTFNPRSFRRRYPGQLPEPASFGVVFCTQTGRLGEPAPPWNR